MAPQPGDFGLVAINGNAGRLIRFAQWLNGDGFGDYQHAVLVLDNGELIEAEPVAAGRGLVGTPYSALDYFALIGHRLHVRRWSLAR